MARHNSSFLLFANKMWGIFKATAPVLIAIILTFGCAAKTPQPAPPVPAAPPQNPPQWQCNEKADKAMEYDDVETGLHEHARFVAKHPRNPLAHYHLGFAFGQVGDIKQEIAHYEEAVSLGYDHDEQIFFNLAMAYAELSRFDKAVNAFKRALVLNPDSVDALAELVKIYEEIGDSQNERRMLERLLELEPDNDIAKQRLKKIADD